MAARLVVLLSWKGATAFLGAGDGSVCRNVAVRAGVRGPAAAAPRVVVDLDVIADTLPFESAVYLDALQRSRPEGPWAELGELPAHRWRTFDLSAKFSRILAEKRVTRPAEATLILRMLFEEQAVGERARAARADPSGKVWRGGGWAPTDGDLAGVRPGTRPLTAGEVVENWDEVLLPRCAAAWAAEDAAFSLDALDGAVAAAARERLAEPAAARDAIGWRPDALRALRQAADEGRVRGGAPMVLVRADLCGLGSCAGWDAVVAGVLPGATCATAASAAAVASDIDAFKGQTLYYGGSRDLTLQLSAALARGVEERKAGLHYCHWVSRWRGPVPAGALGNVGVMELQTEHGDFRRALGVALRPGRG